MALEWNERNPVKRLKEGDRRSRKESRTKISKMNLDCERDLQGHFGWRGLSHPIG